MPISRTHFVAKLDKAVSEIVQTNTASLEVIVERCQMNGLLGDHDRNDTFILEATSDMVQMILAATEPIGHDMDYLDHADKAWEAFNWNQTGTSVMKDADTGM